jgi:DNA-binding HxlR family transcriptional regulator
MIFKGHDIKDTKVMSFTKMSNKLDSAQTKKTTPSSSDMAIKMMRRSNILKIIKDKNEVTIKDISTIIKDCSEKTLQRELSGLVLENVLKKEGNKRWSKYSFK